ncbi:discoidin domain-containing protein [Sphingobacterium pedocola]|uniref:F5/8 type C domain-containing protein n=1 Tax=Sphingobacterium pedocola TaxID=2082722 RepID=A0ABR9TC95_9SPHI|nr:discoidin domain-containing protein [Sphingobacterium pedocola]MBE8722951.1 hypothetical protein [Sphingobacterium pedocola]
MKRLNNIGLFLICSFLWMGCTKQDLLLPVVEQGEEQGNIDVIAKPTDVTLVGGYDYKYVVKWPEMSDKTVKVVISFKDQDVEKSVEFTDFTEDGVFVTKEQGNHDFVLISYASNAVVSKMAKTSVSNKGYIIEEVIANAESPFLYEGQMRINLYNPNLADITVTVTYPKILGGTADLLLQSAEENISGLFEAKDGTNSVNIELEDNVGRKVSKQLQYVYSYQLEGTTVTPFLGIVTLNALTNSNIGVKKIKVTYPTASGTAIEEVVGNTLVTFPAVVGSSTKNIEVEYEDVYGRILLNTLNYVYNPSLTTFNTAASKTGWSVVVSANHEGDGGGGPALIDGNTETFWHTPWSGAIPPWPHEATITFNQELLLTKLILNIRHNNGSGAPKEFDLQTSSDGKTFTTHQSFTNTSNVARAVVSFDLATALQTKYVRVSFKNGFNAQFMSLGEISFEGYKE